MQQIHPQFENDQPYLCMEYRLPDNQKLQSYCFRCLTPLLSTMYVPESFLFLYQWVLIRINSKVSLFFLVWYILVKNPSPLPGLTVSFEWKYKPLKSLCDCASFPHNLTLGTRHSYITSLTIYLLSNRIRRGNLQKLL